MPPTVEIIINAMSGAADKEAASRLLAGIFTANGIEARISLARKGGEVVKLARRALEGEAQTIVAGGGDGTVNAIASMVVGSKKTFGVVPLGTLNHFAKDLHIPLDLVGAARTIIAGHAVNVDVGEVNERIFVNNSSLGLYPSIVRQREKVQGLGHGKWPAFLWATLMVLRRYPFLNVRLLVDGADFATRTPFIFVGNNVYEMESFNIGRRARLDAGVLSLYVTHRTSRLGLLKLALRALFKRLRQAEDFIALITTEVHVETRHRRRRPIRVATDGEVTLMTSPLHYRVRPGALRVLVPEETEGAVKDANVGASF
jgi:diacylglycerol kinase family enzyme